MVIVYCDVEYEEEWQWCACLDELLLILSHFNFFLFEGRWEQILFSIVPLGVAWHRVLGLASCYPFSSIDLFQFYLCLSIICYRYLSSEFLAHSLRLVWFCPLRIIFWSISIVQKSSKPHIPASWSMLPLHSIQLKKRNQPVNSFRQPFWQIPSSSSTMK